jgi:hypothetical protein
VKTNKCKKLVSESGLSMSCESSAGEGERTLKLQNAKLVLEVTLRASDVRSLKRLKVNQSQGMQLENLIMCDLPKSNGIAFSRAAILHPETNNAEEPCDSCWHTTLRRAEATLTRRRTTFSSCCPLSFRLPVAA